MLHLVTTLPLDWIGCARPFLCPASHRKTSPPFPPFSFLPRASPHRQASLLLPSPFSPCHTDFVNHLAYSYTQGSHCYAYTHGRARLSGFDSSTISSALLKRCRLLYSLPFFTYTQPGAGLPPELGLLHFSCTSTAQGQLSLFPATLALLHDHGWSHLLPRLPTPLQAFPHQLHQVHCVAHQQGEHDSGVLFRSVSAFDRVGLAWECRGFG